MKMPLERQRKWLADLIRPKPRSPLVTVSQVSEAFHRVWGQAFNSSLRGICPCFWNR